MHWGVQEVHCQICGRLQVVAIANGSYDKARTCGKRCWEEWKWRETLSIMGSAYKPDTRKHDWPCFHMLSPDDELQTDAETLCVNCGKRRYDHHNP